MKRKTNPVPQDVKASEFAKALQNTALVVADLQARLNRISLELSELAANLAEFAAVFKVAKEDPVAGTVSSELRASTVWPPSSGRVC